MAVLVVSMALVACSRTPPRQPGTAACEGERVIVVTNDSPRAVDVFASSAGAPPLILGSVLPGGRSEFVMPFESTYAYTRESDPRTGYPSQRRAQIRYLCRR